MIDLIITIFIFLRWNIWWFCLLYSELIFSKKNDFIIFFIIMIFLNFHFSYHLCIKLTLRRYKTKVISQRKLLIQSVYVFLVKRWFISISYVLSLLSLCKWTFGCKFLKIIIVTRSWCSTIENLRLLSLDLFQWLLIY